MAVIIGDSVRSSFLAGVDTLADAVRITLGPMGRNVALHQKANIRGAEYSDTARPDAPVLVTNDGVTIARSIVLEDPLRNMGAQLVKEAAIAVNDGAGDGTTTTIVIVQALLKEAFRCVIAGADPLALRRGIQTAGDAALKLLADAATPVSAEREIADVATISCQNPELGALIGHAFHAVGHEGIVTVDDSQRMDTTLDIAEGIVFERGLLSPHLASDQIHGSCLLENPYILLTDKKLTSSQDLIPALICAAEDGRDCLIICDGIEDDALALLIQNKREGDMNVACVLAPEYGEGRRWRMDDLAVQTGGLFVSEEMGLSLRDVDRAMLGSAAHVLVERNRTTITGGTGDPAKVKERADQLRYYAEHTDYEFNRKRHAERLAKFVSGVATIKVGGVTEAEQAERKMRAEDAVNAARAAFEEGVVAGGGVALFDVARELEAQLEEPSGSGHLGAQRENSSDGELRVAPWGGLSDGELLGARIALKALRAPLWQIAHNAGENADVVLAHVGECEAGTGFNTATRAYVNMRKAGIVDPLRVTRSALEAAFSAAGTALLTEAGVTTTDRKEDR